jgi:hypothetical protein
MQYDCVNLLSNKPKRICSLRTVLEDLWGVTAHKQQLLGSSYSVVHGIHRVRYCNYGTVWYGPV